VIKDENSHKIEDFLKLVFPSFTAYVYILLCQAGVYLALLTLIEKRQLVANLLVGQKESQSSTGTKDSNLAEDVLREKLRVKNDAKDPIKLIRVSKAY